MNQVDDVMEIIYSMSDAKTIHAFCNSSKKINQLCQQSTFWIQYFHTHQFPIPNPVPQSLKEWIHAAVEAEKIIQIQHFVSEMMNDTNHVYESAFSVNPTNVQYYYSNLSFPGYKSIQNQIVLFFELVVEAYTAESNFIITITFTNNQLTFSCYDHDEKITSIIINPLKSNQNYQTALHLYLTHLIYDVDLVFKKYHF